MTHHGSAHDEHGHTHQPPPTEPSSGWTTYALVKYGIILIITIVVLYFIARFILPRF
ncbi:MAG TPA: hypothetical protein VHL78_08750 [Actinomycetota bacterium]|nr:hypothetical protein [Actinomycetota bacterium]